MKHTIFKRVVTSLIFIGVSIVFFPIDVGLAETIPTKNFPQIENGTTMGCVAPAPNLIHWWPGNGDANDIIGGNHGILQNGATFTAGNVGQGFSFDGIDDFVSLVGSYGGNAETTVEAWINTNVATGNFQAIVSSTTGGEFMHFQLRDTGNPNDVIQLYTDAGGISLPIVAESPTGVFRHVAIAVKSGDTKLYVDGNLVAQDPKTFSTLNATANLRLGSGFAGGRQFNGVIDEVSIYNRALAQTEIQDIVNAGAAGKCTRDRIVVTKTVDSNYGVCDQDCSLREAIDAVSPGGTVRLNPGTYPLTLGQLALHKPLTIVGRSNTDTTIDAQGNSRIFHITELVSVTVKHLALTNGVAPTGGAIAIDQGDVILKHLKIHNNAANGLGGGGIFNTGTVLIKDSFISDNTSSGGDGGGIRNHTGGTMTLKDSKVERNSTSSFSSGGIHNSGEMTILGSIIADNRTEFENGAGIENSGEMLIKSSAITRNRAGKRGGGIRNNANLTLKNSRVTNNRAHTDGGGIYNNGGTLFIRTMTMTGNNADGNGGGLNNQGTANIRESTIEQNRSDNGAGGIHNHGPLTLKNTVIQHNGPDDFINIFP
ncbi:MAG: LamG-like jellyroll fold domain-containing protein [Chloroflexota bacterium]